MKTVDGANYLLTYFYAVKPVGAFSVDWLPMLELAPVPQLQQVHCLVMFETSV